MVENDELEKSTIYLERLQDEYISNSSCSSDSQFQDTETEDENDEEYDDENEDIGNIYECKECSYICDKRQSYIRHIRSKKHRNILCYIYACECGKRYKYRQTLHRHRKECSIAIQYDATNEIIPDRKDTNSDEENTIYKVIDKDTKNIVYTLTKPDENQETTLDTITDTNIVNFLKTIIQKCDSLQDQLSKQNEKLVEISNQPKSVTNITQKNTFNLFQFLDNDCKNALNFSEFLERMVVGPDDLEYLHKHGYLKSVEYVVVQQLIEMEQGLRPLHCLDQKRKSFIVKEKDTWQKEMFPECIQGIIDTYTTKQLKQYTEWKEKNPDWREDDEKNEIGMILSMEIFRPFRREMKEKINNKIANYLSVLVIDKSQYNSATIQQKQNKNPEIINNTS